MPTKCSFILERAKYIYYGGEHIYGKVRFSTTKRFSCEAISLAFVGFGEVKWDEFNKNCDVFHNDSERLETKRVFTGNEDYIYCRLNLKERGILQPGTWDEEFCIAIPENLPGSTTQENGQISYKLVVNLKRPTKCSKIFEQAIFIKQSLDLSDCRFYFVPFTTESNGICFTANGTGFTPGQVVSYTLQQCGNASFLSTFATTKIGLFQSILYTSKNPFVKKKKSVKLVKTSSCNNCSQFPKACIQYGSLQIPLTLPVSSECKKNQILMISYHLEAFVYTNKKKILQKLKIPITIGTKVPKGVQQNQPTEQRLFCYDNYGISDLSLEDLTSEGKQLDLSCTRFKTVPFK